MELQRSGEREALRELADVYVVNRDRPEESRQLLQITGISFPVLLDGHLSVAERYDMLPKPGQPMGSMRSVAQMGFVAIDPQGTIRVQRVDLLFGRHAAQLLQIVRLLSQRPAN